MAAAPKPKGPKDPFDDLEEEKESKEEKPAVAKGSGDAREMSPEDILDQEREVKEEDDDKDESSDDIDDVEDSKKEDKDFELEEIDEPKKTFISKKQPDGDFETKSQSSNFDKPLDQEHTLDDLAAEDEDQKTSQGFSSYAKLGGHNSQFANSGIYSSKNSSGKGSKFHVFILIGIGILVIGATVYLLKSNFTFPSSVIQSTPVPTATQEPTPQPTPTPPSVDRSKFKIRVLNGTATSGLAASEAAKLKNLGYQIERTGNATNSAFTQTQVRTKPGLDSLIQQLIADLASDFSGASSSALKAADTADGEIILGK